MMHIGYFEYDGVTYFFGVASDGTVTTASQLLSEVRVELSSIEGGIPKRDAKPVHLQPTVQAHPEKSINKSEHEYIYTDWVDGFVILSSNDPILGLVYLVFERNGMVFLFRAESLNEAINRCSPSYSDGFGA
ncbi:hypothetical protein ABWH89_09480 [Hoeflea alexandrii]|uniref:hypothetical protein n=1 Tax=Hoeflea alexandrii TaxID=288436 RepID=UPI0035CF942F